MLGQPEVACSKALMMETPGNPTTQDWDRQFISTVSPWSLLHPIVCLLVSEAAFIAHQKMAARRGHPRKVSVAIQLEAAFFLRQANRHCYMQPRRQGYTAHQTGRNHGSPPLVC